MECYKYYVHNGNNADLIRAEFRKRNGFGPAVRAMEIAKMNDGAGMKRVMDICKLTDFVWCQYRSSLGEFSMYERSVVVQPQGDLEGEPEEARTNKKKKKTNRFKKRVKRPAVLNHFDNNRVLTSKRGLYECLAKKYSLEELATFLPHSMVVFPTSESISDGTLKESVQKQFPSAETKIFIMKPGVGTNRGTGIKVVQGLGNLMEEFKRIVGKALAKGTVLKRRSWIVQEYIEHPMLVRGRKFDIRCYVLVVFNDKQTSNQREDEDQESCFQIYFHERAYLRTSCFKYSTKKLDDKFVHLTNDFVQNKSKEYGKQEQGNKLSLQEFAQILTEQGEDGSWVFDSCIPQMRDIAAKTIRSSLGSINPSNHPRCFELFGLDFMVDGPSKVVKLIEVNENPCLQQVCPLLKDMIPKVIQDLFEITMDCTFFGEKQVSPSNEFKII